MKSFPSILLATLFAQMSIDDSAADHISDACFKLCIEDGNHRDAGQGSLRDLILAYDTVSDDNLDAKTKIGNEINCWDVSQLTKLQPAFEDTNFNDRLDCWDTSSFTSMDFMFINASEFDADIGMWDVSRVTSMESMFDRATSFNQDIGTWDVGSVKDFEDMFYNATAFNRDIHTWDTSNAVDMESMFGGATSFNQDIGTWDVGSVKDFEEMFYDATAFNQDIHTWDTSNAVDMWSMFELATSFNQDIGTWDVSSVKDFSAMFRKAASFNQNLCDWKPFPTKFTYGNTPTYAMFEDSGCDFNQLYVGHAVCQSCAPTCKELKKIVYKENEKNKEKTQLLTEVVADIKNSCGWKPKKKIARLQDIIDIYKSQGDDDDTTDGE